MVFLSIVQRKNELINEAETELAFVAGADWKPCSAPEFVLAAIKKATQQLSVSI